MGPENPVSCNFSKTADKFNEPSLARCDVSWNELLSNHLTFRACTKWIRPFDASMIPGRSLSGSAPNEPVQNVSPLFGLLTFRRMYETFSLFVTTRGSPNIDHGGSSG